MYKKIWENNNGISMITKMMVFAICIIFISIGILYLIPPEEPSKEYNCDLPNGIYVVPFQNDNNTTVNNGGWKGHIYICGISNTKWSNVKIYVGRAWNPILEINPASKELADFVYTPPSESRMNPWFLFANGDAFINVSGNRTLVTNSNLIFLNEDNMATLENVNIVIIDDKEKGYISTGDEIYLYKDNNGDGIEDIPSNNFWGFLNIKQKKHIVGAELK